MAFISEDDIEQAILQKLEQHGFELLNCFTVDRDNLNDGSGRSDKRDVIFVDRLKAAALRLNPGLPEETIDRALAILTILAASKKWTFRPAIASAI